MVPTRRLSQELRSGAAGAASDQVCTPGRPESPKHWSANCAGGAQLEEEQLRRGTQLTPSRVEDIGTRWSSDPLRRRGCRIAASRHRRQTRSGFTRRGKKAHCDSRPVARKAGLHGCSKLRLSVESRLTTVARRDRGAPRPMHHKVHVLKPGITAWEISEQNLDRERLSSLSRCGLALDGASVMLTAPEGKRRPKRNGWREKTHTRCSIPYRSSSESANYNCSQRWGQTGATGSSVRSLASAPG
jgi:hypothetical protein